jgi:membrane protein DedA with SNARE-associated domain
VTSVVDEVLKLHGPASYTLMGGLAFAEAAAAQERRTRCVPRRFTAFLRAVMPGLAGTARMAYRRFLVFNAAGGFIWAVGFTLLGYAAGAGYKSVERVAGTAGDVILVAAALAGLVLVIRRHRSSRDSADT